ncbi:hypothetical protein EVA_19994 [gut metagenome]|uniref:Uncharacterized protein n=1 Tax=gut metagenome TaxID=749906 RepID=J9FX02_9ZZZZ
MVFEQPQMKLSGAKIFALFARSPKKSFLAPLLVQSNKKSFPSLTAIGQLQGTESFLLFVVPP